MSIASFGDIASIVDHWRADDITTTGSVVDSMVSQEGAITLNNPDTYNSDPIFEADVTPIGFDGVNMSTSGRSQLNADAGADTDASYSWVMVYRQDLLTASDRIAVTWDSGAGAWTHFNTGTLYWNFGYASELTGPTLSIGEIVTVIATNTPSLKTLQWEGDASGSDSSTSIQNRSCGRLSFGTFNVGQYTLITAAYFNDELTAGNITDIFAYTDKEFINGASASTSNSLFFGANF